MFVIECFLLNICYIEKMNITNPPFILLQVTSNNVSAHKNEQLFYQPPTNSLNFEINILFVLNGVF